MPATIDYKNKYLELRSKYIADLDTAFRLGFEAGGQQAQQQQALDAQAQAQQMEHEQNMAAAGGMGGEQPGEGQPPQDGQQPPQPGAEGQGSELDQHIGKLESMLGSGQEQNPEEVKKSLEAIISLRKTEKFNMEMKKSDMAIKGIAKALHTPAFKLGAQAQHNMPENAKKAVSLQHKIVNDIMKSWKSEENKAAGDIKNILGLENLLGDKE